MEKYNNRYAYHFTMIDNLESIIEHGLLCTNFKNQLGIEHRNIAAEGIQERRSNTKITASTNIHDYVPFYFAKKTPLHLSLLNQKNIDQSGMIFFAIPLSIITGYEGIRFTTRSANTEDMPSFFSNLQIEHLDEVNWNIVDEIKWGYSGLEKNQKMAELLIPERVSLDMIDHIIVWNDSVGKHILEKFSGKNVSCPQIKFSEEYSGHYFLKRGTSYSLITGPAQLCHDCKGTIKSIVCSEYGVNSDIENRIDSHLNRSRTISLTYNGRKDNLYEHLQKVKSNLDEYDEYNNLDIQSKKIVRLAASLHDIGKLKSYMAEPNIMSRADNDHPAKALPILEDIFDGQTIYSSNEIRMIVVLVTYHDLIGDILTKGRDENQLVNLISEQLITSEQEFNMLLALTFADSAEYRNCFTGLPLEEKYADRISELRDNVLNKIDEMSND